MAKKEEFTELEEALQDQITAMQSNQNGLVQENDKYRQIISDLQGGKNVPLIYSKMLLVKKDIGSVGKDQKNSGQGWKFRGIDQFINALHPILNKHGVGINTTVKQSAEAKFIKNEKTGKTSKNTQIIMCYTFFAEDGSSITSEMPAEGVDPGDKGINKALSAAFKYCLIQTFCVPTVDMAEADQDNATVDDDFVTSSKKTPDKKSPKKEGSIDPKKRFKPKRLKVVDEPEEDDGDL